MARHKSGPQKQSKFVRKMIPALHLGEEGKLLPADLIDTLPKALEYLKECDAARNAAYLIDGSGLYSLLVYEATFFFPRDIPGTFIPENPMEMEAHLYRVFEPFLYKDKLVRSIISTHALTQSERYDERLNNQSKKRVQLTMLLYLPKALQEDVYKKLDLLSDGKHTVKTEMFSLD